MNTVSRIYLGRNIGTEGLKVSNSQLAQFLKQIVVPSFDGFTVIEGLGFWKGVQEPVMIVEIVHDGGKDSTALVLFIAETYAARFSQDCVMTTAGLRGRRLPPVWYGGRRLPPTDRGGGKIPHAEPYGWRMTPHGHGHDLRNRGNAIGNGPRSS